MKYEHLIRSALAQPWMITDAKLDLIAGVLARRAAGEVLSFEEMCERVGVGAYRPIAPLMILDQDSGQTYTSAEAFAQSQGESQARAGSRVAVVNMIGVVAQRASEMDASEGIISIDRVAAIFQAMVDDPSIGAVLLNIASPGGSVYGVDEMAKRVFDARARKTIGVLANSQMGSAAYYVGSQATPGELAVTPGGEVGSIGCVWLHQNLSGWFEKQGVENTLIYAGKNKVLGTSLEPLSEEGRAKMEEVVQRYNDMFVTAVSRGRGVTKAMVNAEFGQGLMFGAKEAVANGMADRVATLDEMIARMAKAKLPAAQAQAVAEATQPGESGFVFTPDEIEPEKVAALAAAWDASHADLTNGAGANTVEPDQEEADSELLARLIPR